LSKQIRCDYDANLAGGAVEYAVLITGDINFDNVVDVQLVINAALGVRKK